MQTGEQPGPEQLQRVAARIAQRLQQAGFEAYWVGGCVRDYLLGRTPKDYDVATSARPEQVEKLFHKTIPVGRQFGVIVVVEEGCPVEVATFRAEAEYTDGRHPGKVSFSNARADALRRDFTVNGLFHDPVAGETHDWVGGKADLERKLIRTIGNPDERFSEDHLRLLRAARFAAQLEFTLEEQTLSSVRSNAGKIVTISAERIRDELLKLLAPPHALRGLDLLRGTGLLEHILPEFVPTITSDQSPEFHPEGTVYEHVRLMLSYVPKEAHPLLPWAVLLHDIGKPATFSREPVTGVIRNYGHERVGADMTEALLTRLRFPKRDIELLRQAVRCHMQFKDAMDMRKSTLRRLLLRPTFPFELELHRLDCLGSNKKLDVFDFLVKEAEELEKKPQIRPALVNGNDLAALGMKPGPAMGSLLREIREKQLSEELTTREEALNYARGQIGQ